jgi:hypothetical protein
MNAFNLKMEIESISETLCFKYTNLELRLVLIKRQDDG